MAAAAKISRGILITLAGQMPRRLSRAAEYGSGRSEPFKVAKRLLTIMEKNISTELSGILAASAQSVWTIDELSVSEA
jgi:hypothetical protein